MLGHNSTKRSKSKKIIRSAKKSLMNLTTLTTFILCNECETLTLNNIDFASHNKIIKPLYAMCKSY